MGIYGNLLMIKEQQELEFDVFKEFNVVYEAYTVKEVFDKIIKLLKTFKEFIKRKVKEIFGKIANFFKKQDKATNEIEKIFEDSKKRTSKLKSDMDDLKDRMDKDKAEEENRFKPGTISYYKLDVRDFRLVQFKTSMDTFSNNLYASFLSLSNLDEMVKMINKQVDTLNSIDKNMKAFVEKTNNLELESEKIEYLEAAQIIFDNIKVENKFIKDELSQAGSSNDGKVIEMYDQIINTANSLQDALTQFKGDPDYEILDSNGTITGVQSIISGLNSIASNITGYVNNLIKIYNVNNKAIIDIGKMMI